jgi:ATP-dependent Clp protease, protease subunit
MNARRRAIGPYPAPAPTRRPLNGAPAAGWELAFYGDLSDKQSDLLSRLVEVPPKSRGTIFFDSGGGSVYAGLALASVIQLRGLDAAGVVAGECSSAALLPFAACRRRFVTPHSSMLFHPIRWSSEEDVRFEEAVEWARHFALLEKDIDDLLARMFDMPREKLEEWTRPGRFVSGSELAESGLATMVDLFAGDVWAQMGR